MPVPAEICFVIGMGRSGTTLLAKLLNQHPKIHGLPEAVFMIFFMHAWKNRKEFNEKDIDLMFEQIKWFSGSHPMAGWKFDETTAKKETLNYIKQHNPGYTELCKFIAYCIKPEKQNKDQAIMLADKNPSYTLFADHLNEIFPEAKFIYIVRDYRANVLSRKQNVDLRSPDIHLNAWLWNFYNQRAFRFYNKNRDKCIMLRYEDLVKDSKTEIQNVLNFLELDPAEMIWEETAQFSGIKKEDHQVPPGHEERFIKKYTDLNKPISTSRAEAWKTELSEAETQACDAICQPMGKVFGYMPVSKPASANKYLGYYIKARLQIGKEDLIYYLSPGFKLNRLKKVYTRLGLSPK